MPRIVPRGSRTAAYDDFKTAHTSSNSADYVAMLIDSEEPVADIEATWDHLKSCDGWAKPRSAEDDQVLLMTTCMETWIIADRTALADHYGKGFQKTALPKLVDLEARARQGVQQALTHATRKCSNAYKKGVRSFEVLAKLDPATLQRHLPSFRRARRVLEEKLS
jgi:hypothetical protein